MRARYRAVFDIRADFSETNRLVEEDLLMIGRGSLLMMATVSFAFPALGQRIQPAALHYADARSLRLRDSASPSLKNDVTRGAKYGAITGAILSVVTIAAIRQSGSCGTAEDPCSHVGTGQSAVILTAGAAGGALVGAMLGWTYHDGRHDHAFSAAERFARASRSP
jgi:hypothetical protein